MSQIIEVHWYWKSSLSSLYVKWWLANK